VLMTIELGAARGFRIIAMPHADVLQSNGRVELPHGFFISFGRNNVVTRNMRVARINTGRDRDDATQPVKQFRDLFERTAQGIFRAGGVLDRDLQSILGKIEALSGAPDGIGGGLQSDLPGDFAE